MIGGDPDWRTRAACRGSIDDEVWFPKTKKCSRTSKRICEGPDPIKHPELGCPVKQECLDDALAHGVTFGTWGGLDAWELSKLQGRASPSRILPRSPRMSLDISPI